MRLQSIRNFCIIAHIDHGKSTLADRFLELTGAIEPRKLREQVLDDLELERERGITIKASAVALTYRNHSLNLIDTPGHIDFSYEVSRALRACEGAVLVVDASQGVEAQTVANYHLALDAGLEIIAVINKVDLSSAQPELVAEEIERSLEIDTNQILYTSARLGTGIQEVLDAVIERCPPPEGEPDAPLRALIFDSTYDEYRGAVVYVRLFDGVVKPGQKLYMMKTSRVAEVHEVGTFTPEMTPRPQLTAGEVGYIITNIRTIHDVDIGDTITEHKRRTSEPLPGYSPPRPMVFCGFYPAGSTSFEQLRQAIEKLHLNDSAFVYQTEISEALGMGFRCGFLGLLHMDIVQERLEREQGLELIKTAPNVTYEVHLRDGKTLTIDNPTRLPDPSVIEQIREPVMRVSLVVPAEFIGATLKLAESARGRYVSQEYISPTRVIMLYDIPLAEMIYDFYDRLKSITRGYGTMDYDFLGYRPSDLVKLDILVAGKKVDALSTIVHRQRALHRGKTLVKKLKKEIPRHLFEVVIQAAIGSRVIARESIRPLAKHVTGKCYGGDITRKRKLLKKQRKGKQRLKRIGSVDLPQEAFLAVLSTESEETAV